MIKEERGMWDDSGKVMFMCGCEDLSGLAVV